MAGKTVDVNGEHVRIDATISPRLSGGGGQWGSGGQWGRGGGQIGSIDPRVFILFSV